MSRMLIDFFAHSSHSETVDDSGPKWFYLGLAGIRSSCSGMDRSTTGNWQSRPHYRINNDWRIPRMLKPDMEVRVLK